jgi:ABC-2 type transport system permease protein
MINTKKNYAILNFILLIICVILINIIANFFFFRFDLTEEKRFTMANVTKNTLQLLDDVVTIEVYLEGDFPAGFKRLQRSIRETLDEFRIYGGANIQYKFFDPLAEKDEKAKSKIMVSLAEKGLQPTNIFANENGKQTEKLVFPGALITYKGKELPVLFLKGAQGASPSEILNQSVEGVEFELISAIKKLAQKSKKRIAILEGHGELPNLELDDLYRSLNANYLVERLNLNSLNDIRSYFDLMIIARPTQYFSEHDKLKIDQFITHGGNVLFLIDKVNVDIEKLSDSEYLATAFDLNLDDLLFRYGVRLNNSLIQDLQSGALPMVVGMMGDKPQTQLVPWLYFPVHTQYSKHPTVRNMGAVLGKFEGTIDTVKAIGIRKTPLMFASKYSKEKEVPLPIQLTEAKKQPDPIEFQSTEKPVAYLLEGNFKSLYVNRLTQQKMDSIDFRSEKTEAKIVVFSDGDIARNEISPDKQQVFPMGFDRYMRKKFANKDLIENLITYLLDDNGIIQVRNKEVKLRPLDKQKVKKEKLKWQLINVALPVILVILFGVIKSYLRKQKYSSSI